MKKLVSILISLAVSISTAAPPTTGQFLFQRKAATGPFQQFGVTPVAGQAFAWDGGNVVMVTPGTVSSVGVSLPGIFNVTGSPVTTSGTISATLANQTAGSFFAGPASGPNAPPSFRAMATTDLPSSVVLDTESFSNPSWITSLEWSKIDGAPAFITGVDWGEIGGTLSAQTDLSAALSGKEPTITAGTTGQYWRGDKTWQTLDKSAVGLGNVENTALSTWAGSANITTLGTISTGTVPTANVSGLAASATTDTTNAANISSGTLPSARLPTPGVATLGGVMRNTGAPGDFVVGINTDGSLNYSTPAGAGTVTSVAVSGSDGIQVDSGSPVTTSGTIALGVDAVGLRSHINVEDGAEVNPTGAEIKILYEGEADTNAFTDAEKTKLAGIESGADSLPSGMVTPFAGSSAPSGWILCYGQAISRATYADLFAAIGTTYGAGDGSTTFNVPDLRGRVAAGKDNMGGSAASRLTNSGTGNPGINGSTLGASGGADRHQLTAAQMPSHTHGYSTLVAGNGVAFGNGLVGSATTTGTAGSDQAHPNAQPTLVLNYIIKH